jgi:DNA-binding CsgD family transcriptional regulator/tetratricopeptide (TPR) repeat protein
MLHGRSAEVARIDDLLVAARDGRSGVLVIRGEAGVGKTALLDHAAAAGGMRVLRGTGIESEAELPFAALQLLLRPGLGRLDVLPPPQARALRGAFGLAGTPGTDRFLIGLAALSLLSELAGDGALLCLIDDAHWLDRASADALLFAARRLESEGVVLLVVAREDGFDAPGLPELPLGRLSRDASRALLAERAPGLPPGLADRVLAEADGNPLALLELPVALSGASGVPVALAMSPEFPAPLPLPRRLQQTYYRQVAALPGPTRTFLLVAAAEETGDLGLVRRAAQALGVPATASDAAERSGLIAVDTPAVAFRHPLVRAAVYQGATSAERAAAHGALAVALDDPLAGVPDPDRRAWHLAAAAAGPDERVAAALEQAADRARQRLGHAAAAAALERAARLTPAQPDRARRLIAAAGAALDSGRPDAASALADQGESLTAEPGALAEIARVRAWVAMERGAMHRVHELVVAGAGPIASSDPLAAAAMLRLGAVAGWWAGDAKLVQDAADRMTGLSGGGLIPGPGALQAMADLLAGRPAAAVPRLAEVVAAVRHSRPEQLAVRFYAANMALLIGDFDSARDLMLSTAQACRTQGVIRFLAPLSLGLSCANFCLTRFRAATEAATEGLRLAEDTGQPVRAAGLYSMLALLAAVAGDEPRCHETAARAGDQFAGDEVANVAAMAEWALGLLDLGLGRYAAALERFELTASGAMRHYIQPILFAPDQVEAALRLGADDRAAEPLARFASWAGATGQPWALAVLHRCQALTRDGDTEGHYREALRQHAVSGRPFEHARTALLYGEWLRRGRRGTDARAPLRAALALFDRTGARPWAGRARAELRAAGEPAAAGAPAPDRLSLLTSQELQVVRLAASGATNRDIAAQLFISPRTVSHHLYRAFPKLGVTNRTALARLDLTGPDDLP